MRYIKAIYKAFSLFGKKITHDAVAAFSAQTAFFIIISAFPFLVLIVSVLEKIPFISADMMYTVLDIFPRTVMEYMENIIKEICSGNSVAIISISAAVLLWAASKGVTSIMRGLNFIYKIDEKRNFLEIRLVSVGYTIGFVVYIVLTLIFIFGGGMLSSLLKSRLPENLFFTVIYRIVSFLGKLMLLTVLFGLVYLIVPKRKATIKSQLPGAVLSALGWLGYSWFYSFYIDHLAGNSYVYGSLTSIILIMLWLYVCMYIFFIGGEVNSIISGEELWEIESDFEKGSRK